MRTVGVEEELLVVDPVSWRPVPGAHELRAAAVRGAMEPPEHEFKLEQAEIATAPFESLAALRADLQRRRHETARAAQAQGLAVAALATSPLPVHPHPTPGQRYDRMQQRFGLLAQAQLTCGMHVHVAVTSRDDGVRALDRIRPWLPVLTALSANSPFWQGQDTEHASYRTVVWGLWPTVGPTQAFGDARGYDTLVESLLATDTILDAGMLYFDARLSASYPTVEIRVADVCSSLDDALLVPALARAMVDAALTDCLPAVDVRVELLRVASWRAAATALSGSLVDTVAACSRPAGELLHRLLAFLRPSLTQAGDLQLVEDGIARLLRDGTGADRQRRVADETGSLEAVVADAVQQTCG